ncbi:MAG: hypothetical protein P8Y09_09485, partial [Deltaproteobacteria bacterium]
MDKKELIDLLNNDLDDEHAAILRYVIHGYLEGEDTPIGASLLSRSREEMWHMHWLGMAIGQLGGEPNLSPAPYPYDPTNRATIFKTALNVQDVDTEKCELFIQGKGGTQRRIPVPEGLWT